jgi:FkbM family methyltransferase
MSEAWKFRNDTLDKGIFNGVVIFNEYRLPPSFAPGDIVLDIGAHIGSFAYAALSRGCKSIYSIEPDRANFEIASENLKESIEQGHVQLVNGAVWRSDPNDDELRFDGYHPFPKSYEGMEGIINTGNGSVIWGTGVPVAKFAFDEIMDYVTNKGEKRVRLLKLDCEGAEWPILLTSQRLHLIDEICGEFHEIGGEFLEISEDRALRGPIFEIKHLSNFTVERLVRYLNDAGFSVSYQRHRRPTGALEGLGLFFARRSSEQVGTDLTVQQSAI